MQTQMILDKLDEIAAEVKANKGKTVDVENAQYEYVLTLIKPIVMEMEQRTEEWYKARLGVLSASTASEAVSSYVSAVETCADRSLAEMAVGRGESIPINAAIQWGMDQEDWSRQQYELREGVTVKEVGFVYLNEDKRIGCSPDGLVGDEGLVEFKNPNSSTHQRYSRYGILEHKSKINGNKVKAHKYFYQIQQQLLVCNRDWCDFVSADSRAINKKQQLYVQRIYKCKKTQLKIFKGLLKVINIVDSHLESLGLKWDKDSNNLVDK